MRSMLKGCHFNSWETVYPRYLKNSRESPCPWRMPQCFVSGCWMWFPPASPAASCLSGSLRSTTCWHNAGTISLVSLEGRTSGIMVINHELNSILAYITGGSRYAQWGVIHWPVYLVGELQGSSRWPLLFGFTFPQSNHSLPVWRRAI